MKAAILALVAGMSLSTASIADVVYQYDSAGRLIRASYSNGVVIEYRYDAAGNRREIVSTTQANSAPVANPDTVSIEVSTTASIMLLANDTDANGDRLRVTTLGSVGGVGGSVSLQNNGRHVRFSAPASTGTATFSYTASDGRGGTSSSTVTVSVVNTNVAPSAVADSATVLASGVVDILVRANDSDANGDPLTVISTTTPTAGSVSIAAGGTHLTYTAPATPGSYTFSYTVSDGRGGTGSAVVTVTVEDGGCVPPPGQQSCNED